MNPIPRFLSVEDILFLHALAMEDQGGDPTWRYSRDGRAYAFHMCKNHPFVDGNKRAGTAAMIAFLTDNGWSFEASADEAESEILRLASGGIEKKNSPVGQENIYTKSRKWN